MLYRLPYATPTLVSSILTGIVDNDQNEPFESPVESFENPNIVQDVAPRQSPTVNRPNLLQKHIRRMKRLVGIYIEDITSSLLQIEKSNVKIN